MTSTEMKCNDERPAEVQQYLLAKKRLLEASDALDELSQEAKAHLRAINVDGPWRLHSTCTDPRNSQIRILVNGFKLYAEVALYKRGSTLRVDLLAPVNDEHEHKLMINVHEDVGRYFVLSFSKVSCGSLLYAYVGQLLRTNRRGYILSLIFKLY